MRCIRLFKYSPSLNDELTFVGSFTHVDSLATTLSLANEESAPLFVVREAVPQNFSFWHNYIKANEKNIMPMHKKIHETIAALVSFFIFTNPDPKIIVSSQKATAMHTNTLSIT